MYRYDCTKNVNTVIRIIIKVMITFQQKFCWFSSSVQPKFIKFNLCLKHLYLETFEIFGQ